MSPVGAPRVFASACLVSEKPNVESIMTSTERDKYEAREHIVISLSMFSSFSAALS